MQSQHTYPKHCDTGQLPFEKKCDGLLYFQGANHWESWKHLWYRFRCNGCGVMLAAEPEEAAQWVSGIEWQRRLPLETPCES